MFKAMVFFPDGWCKSHSDISPEVALSNLQKRCPERKLRLTYRPMDGTIYNDSHIPCGVVFKVEG